MSLRATAVVLALTTVSGCSRSSAPPPLRIGFASEVPYAFVDRDGQPAGEAPAVARAVLARLRVERVEWTLLPFDGLLPALAAGRIDVVAAGMFVTPERSAVALFSTPTLAVHAALLVPRGNPMHLCGASELAERGRVAVIAGAVEGLRLRRAGVPEARILSVPDATSGIAAVDSGVADAFALSRPSLRAAVKSHADDLEVAACGGDRDPPDLTAFAFRRSDTALRDAWNGALEDYLGSAAHRDMLSGLGFTDADLTSMLAPLAARARDAPR